MRAAPAVAAALLLAAACTAGHHDATATFNPAPSRAELVARAHLAPCPHVTAGGAPSGLPAVTLPCLDGSGQASLAAAASRMPTLVNIWASWCEPCQREVPWLEQAYRAGKGRLAVLGVDTQDSTDSALDFAPHVGMTYPSLVDVDNKVLPHFNPGPPVTLFVSRGQVRYVKRGQYHSAAAVRADVARYLGLTL